MICLSLGKCPKEPVTKWKSNVEISFGHDCRIMMKCVMRAHLTEQRTCLEFKYSRMMREMQ